MKIIYTLLIASFLSFTSYAQQFAWAESYPVSNCNEVGAIAADATGNLIIAGVHNATQNVPYSGPIYILKTDATGQTLWEDELNGVLKFGDMAAVGNDILIIGQATGAFNYRGAFYGQGQYFMFVIMLDENGDVRWHFTDQNRWGINTNIAVGNTGDIALHIRGASNLSDWIYIVDVDGNILQQKNVAPQKTLVMDIAYYDGKVYFNGGFHGPGTVMVDTILVELPDFENASITMGFDENLTAQWLYTGTTINNFAGRIEADENGLVVYEPLNDPSFSDIRSLKRFSFEGTVEMETEVPAYSPFASVRPDLTLTPDYIALFYQNSSNSSSHICVIYDHELNLLSEKVIDGSSSPYAGQIASHDNDLFISHIHSGDLNFNNELAIDYPGSEKRPYIAKISSLETGISDRTKTEENILVSPNPAHIYIDVSFFANDRIHPIKIFNNEGRLLLTKIADSKSTRISISHLPSGIYFVEAAGDRGSILRAKFIKP